MPLESPDGGLEQEILASIKHAEFLSSKSASSKLSPQSFYKMVVFAP